MFQVKHAPAPILVGQLVTAAAKWLCVGGLAVTLAGPARAAAPDWSAFDWLVGHWTAEGGGVQQGQGGFSFDREAGGQVLVRRNFAEYPAHDGKPPERHEDLMVIAWEGPTVRATYWDSEGHAIHYRLTSPSAGQAVFLSDDPEGPRFRLSYQRTEAGLKGRFEIAPPNDREHFADYLAWTARRAP